MRRARVWRGNPPEDGPDGVERRPSRESCPEDGPLSVETRPSDAADDWVRAGQALSRVLLTACTRGLQAGYANQPIQVETLRPRVAALADRPGSPQLLLRLGFPTTRVTAASRRPVDDVIVYA